MDTICRVDTDGRYKLTHLQDTLDNHYSLSSRDHVHVKDVVLVGDRLYCFEENVIRFNPASIEKGTKIIVNMDCLVTSEEEKGGEKGSEVGTAQIDFVVGGVVQAISGDQYAVTLRIPTHNKIVNGSDVTIGKYKGKATSSKRASHVDVFDVPMYDLFLIDDVAVWRV